jgi:hypothetical protein
MFVTKRTTSDSALADDTDHGGPHGPDSVVLAAMRAWLRPDCDAMRGRCAWRDVLLASGATADTFTHLDTLMRSLTIVVARPLDIRCRCCTHLGKDEEALLHGISLFQRKRVHEAVWNLAGWVSLPAASGVAKTLRRLAEALAESGIEVPIRERSVVYMH